MVFHTIPIWLLCARTTANTWQWSRNQLWIGCIFIPYVYYFPSSSRLVLVLPPPIYLACALLSSDQEALLGAFPSANGDVNENPFSLSAETQGERMTQQSCKQLKDGLPEKLVITSLLDQLTKAISCRGENVSRELIDSDGIHITDSGGQPSSMIMIFF